MFKVGDEVLCVDNKGAEMFLKLNSIYIVSDMGHSCDIGIEIGSGRSQWFYPHRFIPNTPEAKAEYMRKKLEEAE